MSDDGPVFSSLPQPEVVTTNQPMYYGLPGYNPNVPYVQQPGYPQMPMMQTIACGTYMSLCYAPTTFPLPHKCDRHCLLSGLLVWCCTPCYSCYLSVELGESCCLPMCFCPGECIPACGTAVPWLVALRVKIREANKIKGSILGDCMAVYCCPLCVMCQLKREHSFIRQYPNYD